MFCVQHNAVRLKCMLVQEQGGQDDWLDSAVLVPFVYSQAKAVLQHPWLCENGVASDAPLENEIQHRLKKFQDLNRFKRQALKLIASYLSPEEVSGLRNQFQVLDKDGNGASSH